MKTGEKVKWVDGMGFEHKGIVDWDAVQQTASPVPVRDNQGVIRWIEIRNLEPGKSNP